MGIAEALLLINAPPPPESTQQVLFHVDPDPELLRQRANEVAHRDITSRTEHFLTARASEYAWSKRQTNQVRRTLKVLQLVFPGANLQFRASDILALRSYNDHNVRSTIEVLEDAGLLIDDRAPSFDLLFARKTVWDGSDETGWTGMGQRVWTTDAAELGMLDVRELILQA